MRAAAADAIDHQTDPIEIRIEIAFAKFVEIHAVLHTGAAAGFHENTERFAIFLRVAGPDFLDLAGCAFGQRNGRFGFDYCVHLLLVKS